MLTQTIICLLFALTQSRPQTEYYPPPQLPYYQTLLPNNYYQPSYQQTPYNYQPFYSNPNYYPNYQPQPIPSSFGYDVNFPYQLDQVNYPYDYDLGLHNYDQLNEVPDLKSPVQILPSKFPPRVEQIVERIQNYFSTYAHLGGEQPGVEVTTQGSKIGNNSTAESTPSSTTDNTETTTDKDKEDTTTEGAVTEPSNDIDGPTDSEETTTNKEDATSEPDSE